jgi:hypothetical protein
MNADVAKKQPAIYGLLAEYSSDEALLAAAVHVRSLGYRRVEAYSPYPIHGLASVLGIRGVRLPWIVLIGGILGCITALVMQWYSAVIDFPINVGGRPYASWPAFMPIAFELTILFAGFGAVLGMFAINGLPQPYHPLFNVPEFARASRAGFFLCVEARDARFDLTATRSMLLELGAQEVFEVMP